MDRWGQCSCIGCVLGWLEFNDPVVVVLKFLRILSLNVSSVGEVEWDSGVCQELGASAHTWSQLLILSYFLGYMLISYFLCPGAWPCLTLSPDPCHTMASALHPGKGKQEEAHVLLLPSILGSGPGAHMWKVGYNSLMASWGRARQWPSPPQIGSPMAHPVPSEQPKQHRVPSTSQCGGCNPLGGHHWPWVGRAEPVKRGD